MHARHLQGIETSCRSFNMQPVSQTRRPREWNAGGAPLEWADYMWSTESLAIGAYETIPRPS